MNNEDYWHYIPLAEHRHQNQRRQWRSAKARAGKINTLPNPEPVLYLDSYTSR
jgi:hypothetical protein